MNNDDQSLQCSMIQEMDDIETPKAPRGKRSDLTEKDLEEFTRSFSSEMLTEDVDSFQGN
jgi:hypothetical protein